MCGIALILRRDEGPIPGAWVDALSGGIAWRGPDEAGQCVVRRKGLHAVLVHHRLAILDIAGGRQPMTLPPGARPDLAVVFNGCIYNHRALRRELEALGRRFHSDHSDTEVLLHGYAQWGGEELLRRIEGMYAFALLDATKGTLLAARDPFGEKPLYRAAHGGIELVGSDPAALSAVMSAALNGTSTPRPLLLADPSALAHYLLLGFPHPARTLFGPAEAPVQEVPRTARVAPPATNEDTSPEDDPLRWFESALRTSVHARLEADRPTGCFLSGGIDSSLVAALAREVRPDLPTFCVRMPDAALDESAHAAHVARHLGTRHVTLDAETHDPAEDLRMLIEHMHAPFGDSSLLAAHAVARAASAHVTVALTGDGGDELFYGYDRYRGADVLACAKALLRLLPLPASLPGAHSPLRALSRAGRMASAARDAARLGPLAISALTPLPILRNLIDGDIDTLPLPHVAPGGEALRTHDIDVALPGDLLRKVDIAAMAAGVETRAPFLDSRLAAAALQAPRALLAGSGPKSLLRAIAARHLPAEICRRRKQGFAIPLASCLRDPKHALGRLAFELLTDRDAFAGLPIRRAAAIRLLTTHRARGPARRDHAHRLFALMTLELFRRSITRR